jgi:hypothetical protein
MPCPAGAPTWWCCSISVTFFAAFSAPFFPTSMFTCVPPRTQASHTYRKHRRTATLPARAIHCKCMHATSMRRACGGTLAAITGGADSASGRPEWERA